VDNGGDGTNIAPGCPQVATRTDTQTRTREGGNPDLIPESADTFTAGFVWTPGFEFGDLSLTVDWWRIELVDAIGQFGVQFTLDQCYIELDQESCALITRRNDADFTIDNVLDLNVNVAEQTGEGVDTEIRFAFETGIGDFDTAFLWSHLTERNRIPFPGGNLQQMKGMHFLDSSSEDGGTYAEDKFNFSLRWFANDSFSVSYLAEFVGEIKAEAAFQDYTQTVDSQLYHDLVFDYELSAFGTTRLTLGATNLTDEAPPYIDRAFNASTDPTTYRVLGRGYFFRLSQTFE
jgi:iron complex outermembrane receptor protein